MGTVGKNLIRLTCKLTLVQQLPFLYDPGPHITVGECLVPFRGRFRQYMPSKPAKYGIKIWAA